MGPRNEVKKKKTMKKINDYDLSLSAFLNAIQILELGPKEEEAFIVADFGRNEGAKRGGSSVEKRREGGTDEGEGHEGRLSR